MSNRSAHDALSRFMRFFKALPEGIEQDLLEVTDSWSDPAKRGVALHSAPDVHAGPMESASGSGATAMVSDYSTDLSSGDGLVRAYSALSQQLTQQNRRIEAIEKAAVSLAAFLARSSGVPLPAALKAIEEKMSAEEAEEETEEERREREESGDKKEAKKADLRHLPLTSVPDLLTLVAGKSRGTGVPPDFAVQKARGDSIDAMIAESDLSPSEAIGAQSIVSRLRSGQNFSSACLGVGDRATSFVRGHVGL